ncbi:uncharacterized protein LOC120890526 isoform X2 [Ictidomys tridecemlineatus]|uniref:translation initiation factor IF-2-like isoform X2 n=1 Tax=Ictidomys tridecemlineatus TaxID=43179 RepID=UPI001A9F8E7D|nr:translation initiation factor IF-2-like isoform X2 [Ictidomys tridecemlineatus]
MDEEPPPQGIPRGGGDGPAPSGDGPRQLGPWREATRASILALLQRTRPPSHRQAQAPAAPTFPRRRGIHSQPPPPPAPHPQPSEAPPLQPPAGLLAFTGTNRRLASTTLVPIRAGRRRGFSNVIQAPPGAPRSLLFGESQTGIELASLPGGSDLLRPGLEGGLEGGLAPFPGRVLQLSTFRAVTGLSRGEGLVFYPDCMLGLKDEAPKDHPSIFTIEAE